LALSKDLLHREQTSFNRVGGMSFEQQMQVSLSILGISCEYALTFILGNVIVVRVFD